jgi:hypothetical protein
MKCVPVDDGLVFDKWQCKCYDSENLLVFPQIKTIDNGK